MLISIVIPFHEYSTLLDRMLAGIIPQLCDQIELILVGDGISSSTADIIRAKYNKAATYTIPKTGANTARQYGINKSCGDYILLLDSDDELPMNVLSIYKTIITELHPDIIIANVNRYIEDICKGPFYKFKSTDKLISKAQLTNDQLYNFPILIFCKCFQKKLVDNITFTDSSMYQDFSITSILFKQAELFYYTSKVTYHYHTRKGSVSSIEANTSLNIKAARTSIEAVVSHYKDSKLNISEKKYLRLACIRFYYTLMLRSMSILDKTLCIELRKDFRSQLSVLDLLKTIQVPKAFIMGLIMYNKVLFYLYYVFKNNIKLI